MSARAATIRRVLGILRSLPRAALAAAACAACPACQRTPEPAQALVRIELGARAVGEDVSLAWRWTPAEPRGWKVSGTEFEIREGAGGPAYLALAASDQARLALRPGEALASSVQRVLVRARARGGARHLRVGLRGDPEAALDMSPAVKVWPGAELQPFVFDFPELARSGEPPEQVVVHAFGDPSALDVAEVQLFHVPLGRWLPSAGAPELCDVGGEQRRAVGLVRGAPLEAALELPPRARLDFAWAVPPGLAPEGASYRLRGRARAAGGARAERTWELAAGAPHAWQSLSWSLAELGPGAARLAFDFDLAPGAAAGLAEGEQAACALAELSLDSARAEDAPAPPTVLFVTSDTHRGDHLSALSGALVQTPCLDALAARGVLFERAFSTTTITMASHAAMLSGLHPRDSGLFNNTNGLSESAGTLAERFAEAGYATWAVTSAVHLGSAHSGLGQGFDRYSAPSAPQRSGAESIAVLEGWLADRRDQPLFVWLHLFDAHGPYEPPEPFRSRYWPERDPFDPALALDGALAAVVPSYLPGLRDLSLPAELYRGEIDALDARLAGLLALPRFAEATVAVTGDHGESLGAHDIWFEHGGLYPDTVHVPLILAWPGAAPGQRGRRVPANVSNVDVGRTLLDLAGLGEADFPGRSLTRFLELGAAADEPVFTIDAFRRSASLTVGHWHLIVALVAHQPIGFTRARERHATELYDLDSDPECLRDLSASEVERARALRAELAAWLAAAPEEQWSFAEPVDAEIAAALEALGYVGESTASAGSFAEALPADCACDACLPFFRE